LPACRPGISARPAARSLRLVYFCHLGRRRRVGRPVAGGERTAGGVLVGTARAAMVPLFAWACCSTCSRPACITPRWRWRRPAPPSAAPPKPARWPRSRAAGAPRRRSIRTFCQQSSLHRRPGYHGTARGPGNVRAPLRLPSRHPGAGRPREHPLREELALARGYLEVEQVRFGPRLRVEEEIEPACEDCAVPALLLNRWSRTPSSTASPAWWKALPSGWPRAAPAHRFPSPWKTPSTRNARAAQPGNGWPRPPPAPGALRRGCVLPGRSFRRRLRVVLRLPCESPMASSSRA